MSFTRNSLAIVLAAALSGPVMGQKASPAPAGAATIQTYQPKVSSAAVKEIVALQKAVQAKDTASIPALLAAAQAKAKTNDDRYAIGLLQFQAAAAANDDNALLAGVDAMAESKVLPAAQTTSLYASVGGRFYNAKQYDKAAAVFQKAIAADPGNGDMIVELARVRVAQGNAADALAQLNRGIAAKVAIGGKPDESWYKVALSTAYNGKLPGVDDAARAWVSAYPSKVSWREALRVYLNYHKLSPAAGVDVSRLMYAAGVMDSESDYYRLASSVVTTSPGEAKAVLDQGIQAGIVKKNEDAIAQLYKTAEARAQGDRSSLDASSKAALAQPAASRIVRNADAYYGYGDYAKAAELYRAALGKSGGDANLINLRLGMALARAGDKAGATAALNAAGGAQAGIAKLWLLHLDKPV